MHQFVQPLAFPHRLDLHSPSSLRAVGLLCPLTGFKMDPMPIHYLSSMGHLLPCLSGIYISPGTASSCANQRNYALIDMQLLQYVQKLLVPHSMNAQVASTKVKEGVSPRHHENSTMHHITYMGGVGDSASRWCIRIFRSQANALAVPLS